MCPGPPKGLPIESSQALIRGMTCSMPCIVPMNKESAETARNLTRLRWYAPSAQDTLDTNLVWLVPPA